MAVFPTEFKRIRNVVLINFNLSEPPVAFDHVCPSVILDQDVTNIYPSGVIKYIIKRIIYPTLSNRYDLIHIFAKH